MIVYALQEGMALCYKYMVELQAKQERVGQQNQILEKLRECLMALGHEQTREVAPIVHLDDVANCGSFSIIFPPAKRFPLNSGNIYVVLLYQTLKLENSVQFIDLNHGFGIFELEGCNKQPCQPYVCIFINYILTTDDQNQTHIWFSLHCCTRTRV
jgi:hypothetical protein